MKRAEPGLISLLRSTLASLEEEATPSADDGAVSDLKRTVLRQVADLELRKAERMEHAAEVASVLARAGRAAYVVDPVAAKATLAGAAAEPEGALNGEPVTE